MNNFECEEKEYEAIVSSDKKFVGLLKIRHLNDFDKEVTYDFYEIKGTYKNKIVISLDKLCDADKNFVSALISDYSEFPCGRVNKCVDVDTLAMLTLALKDLPISEEDTEASISKKFKIDTGFDYDLYKISISNLSMYDSINFDEKLEYYESVYEKSSNYDYYDYYTSKNMNANRDVYSNSWKVERKSSWKTWEQLANN